MKLANKIGTAIIVLLFIFIISASLLSESGSDFLGKLSNLLQNGGPLMVIVFSGGLIGIVLMIGFLFGMPVPGRDTTSILKNTQEAITKSNGVLVDITIQSGFKFAVGFMFGIAVTGVILIPLLLVVISSVLSGFVGKL